MTTAWHQLSPSEFEQAVAWVLATQGYQGVEVVGGAGDLGVDIRCHDQGGNLVVVQCKRYAPNKRIGSRDIQHFMAMALHHGAVHKIFVTTASYTPQAIALAQSAGVVLIDGPGLAALAHRSQVVANYPDPSVPVVLPNSLGSGMERLTFLQQLLPQTPIIQENGGWGRLTHEQQRDGPALHARLLALTPEQFRKTVLLHHLGRIGEPDRPGIRPLENQNGRIKDYVVMAHPQPYLQRCHHLPAEQAITAEDIDQVIYAAEVKGFGLGMYSTTGLFSAGAMLKTMHSHSIAGWPVGLSDGWTIAYSLANDFHGGPMSFQWLKGKDFITLARHPGWPTKLEEGTERPQIIRKLFPKTR
jgi:Restriction endonuclease